MVGRAPPAASPPSTFGFNPLGTALVCMVIVAITAQTTILVFTLVIVALALFATMNPHVRAAGHHAA